MTSLVDVRDVTLSYGRGRAREDVLAGISMSVEPGEIVGVQGPSGCGKSTLLRVISTVQSPTHGEVLLGGRRVSGPRLDGFIMPITQNASGALDPRWPIWKSVTEPLMARQRSSKPSSRERREIAREALATVGLGALDVESKPAGLSGGQCQRIVILRALVAKPRLIVADEPTAALDVSVAAGVLRLIAEAADTGIGVVIASHDRSALQVLCDRILVMDKSVVVSGHRGDRRRPHDSVAAPVGA